MNKGHRDDLVSHYTELGEGHARRWALSDRGNQCIYAERDAALTRHAVEAIQLTPPPLRLLDVGCGPATFLKSLVPILDQPCELVGTDLVEQRVRLARASAPSVSLTVADAECLPFVDGTFAVVIAMTMMSMIPTDVARQRAADELVRVLSPSGAILWYDIRYPSLSNRRIRPVLERDLRRLFADMDVRVVSTTVIPPLSRRLGRATRPLYRALAWVPPLRSHYAGVIVKRHVR